MNGHIENAAEASRRFILFTKGRTASNLLMRILNLNEQPSLLKDERRDYYFYDAMPAKLQWGSFDEPWTAEQKTERMPVFQGAMDNLQGHLDRSAAQGKDVYFKEHFTAFEFPVVVAKDGSENDSLTVPMPDGPHKGSRVNTNNEIVLPDAFLDTLLPTFLIRHPALMFPSMVRAMRDINFDIDALTHDLSLVKPVALYEWYEKRKADPNASPVAKGTEFPLVLDADDVITSPETLIEYTKHVGMDPEKLTFNWEQNQWDTQQPKTAVVERMLNTLSASTGIQKSKAAGDNLDIGAEAVKWREEFGEERGAWIEQVVRDAMPNYEFLKSQRVVPAKSA